MWIRMCDFEAGREERSPIPTRIASNEEFIPPGQSNEQKEVELRLWSLAERAANRLGTNRRDFLRTSCGMAAALIAMNQVFGQCYSVEEEELFDANAFQEKWPKDQFILDIQTHYARRCLRFLHGVRRDRPIDVAIGLTRRTL